MDRDEKVSMVTSLCNLSLRGQRSKRKKFPIKLKLNRNNPCGTLNTRKIFSTKEKRKNRQRKTPRGKEREITNQPTHPPIHPPTKQPTNQPTTSCRLVPRFYSLSNVEIRHDVTIKRYQLPLNVCVVYGIAAKRMLYGHSSEICNLLRVTSRLISKLDREYGL